MQLNKRLECLFNFDISLYFYFLLELKCFKLKINVKEYLRPYRSNIIILRYYKNDINCQLSENINRSFFKLNKSFENL